MSEQNTALDTLPERMILRLDRGYLCFTWLIMFAFFVMCAFLLTHPDPGDGFPLGLWVCLLIFGFFVLAATLELIVPTMSYIELSREGFRMGGALSPLRPIAPWPTIAKVEIYRWWPYRSITWRHGVRISYGRFDEPTTIRSPRIYGWDAEDLAALMTRFRDRALKAAAT